MEKVEGGFVSCFLDLVYDGKSEETESPMENACFDCNICLDVAADPVVTLCGHLYCWACIYRWLHPAVSAVSYNLRQCPVCKSFLSDSSLIPLHGRGIGIAARPGVSRNSFSPDAYDRRMSTGQSYRASTGNNMGVLHSTAGVVLGELAFAMLPWALRNQQGSYFQPLLTATVDGGRRRWRQQEMMAECFLRQLWVFLACCAALCWLVF